MATSSVAHELALWRRAILGAIHAGAPDLTTRQMAVMLTVYCMPAPHTVRGLATELGVAKPVITRALDTLAGLGFLRRRRDENDRRSVFVERTVAGAVYLSDLHDRLAVARDAPPDGRKSDTLRDI